MGKLIDKKTTVLKVLKNEDGSTTITPEQQKFIDEFVSESVTDDCPACDGDGIVGTEYCNVCWGKRKFTYHTELRIVALPKDELIQIEFNALEGPEVDEFKLANQDYMFFTGTEAEWKNIPEDIKAISVDSNGKVQYYSSVSGIYSRYDDEHSKLDKYIGGQYWYFGTSLDGLDITEKHQELKLVVKENHRGIFYRPDAQRMVLDFNEPFDWGIFPKAVKKLFVTFGGMNINSHTIEIEAGSSGIYLRDDNVVWGEGGRTNVDEEFKINLCVPWVDDGTGEYPTHPESVISRKYNEMNLEFRNIPYETVVFKLPLDRSKPVAAIDLERANEERCESINRHTRPIRSDMTFGRYPFKYSRGGAKHEVEVWLLENSRLRGARYEITEDLEIDVFGDISVGKDRETSLKHKFRNVHGKFKLIGNDYTDLGNLPKSCTHLMISHSKSLKRLEVPNTEVSSGELYVQFMNLESVGKLHSSIKKIRRGYVEWENVKMGRNKGVEVEYYYDQYGW